MLGSCWSSNELRTLAQYTTIVSEQQQQQKGKHKVKQPLMSRQRKQLSGLVRMATVDNFQGELQFRVLVQ